MCPVSSPESTPRERRNVKRDLDGIRVWHREVREDLLRAPADLELLAEEEAVAVMLDRLERARLRDDELVVDGSAERA